MEYIDGPLEELGRAVRAVKGILWRIWGWQGLSRIYIDGSLEELEMTVGVVNGIH